MYYPQKKNNTLKFSSAKDIPPEILQNLGCSHNTYFDPDYLFSLEKNHPQIDWNYLVLRDKKAQPYALACIQIIPFSSDQIQNPLYQKWVPLKNIARKLKLLPKKDVTKILVCGNVFVSGEHGLFLKQGYDKQEAIKDVIKAVSNFVSKDPNYNKSVSMLLVKDFEKESLLITDELHDFKFYSFNVEPNMVLTLQKEWQNFDDYLNALKTKFRVKAKRAITLSKDLEVKDASVAELKTHVKDLSSLYNRVTSNASFNLQKFELSTYIDLKEQLGDDYIIRIYWYQGAIVGFMSGMVVADVLDAHFVGIDYHLNRTLAIYQRILYDYIDYGIQRNLTTIRFGRTASEIKSSVGAEPKELTCYIRHKKAFPNNFVSFILKGIQPTPFAQKKPFKIGN